MAYDKINKLLSGRFLLTIGSGLAFLILVIGYVFNCPSISPEAITAIISTVFTSYFMKNRDSWDLNGKIQQ